MSKGIKISPKHGVNPSIQKCFWCQKEMGLILFGKMKDDAEAPKCVTLDYEPCDECKSQWEKGIAVLEAAHEPFYADQPLWGADCYPSGRMMVIRREAMRQMLSGNPDLCEAVMKSGKTFMERDVFQKLLDDLQPQESEKTE